MKADFWLTKKWLLVFSIVFLSVTEASAAGVQLTDTLSVTGLLRHELAIHAAGKKNPNNTLLGQADKNTVDLSRTVFRTEWTYKPNDIFKLYSKVRVISDQTEALDDDLLDYDAFPQSTPRYGTYLRATNDDEVNVEMSELYADVNLGDLWVRLGKQQIVWGEMISARILDIVNPLDLSWHFKFEPEEFENIRVPQWTIRARYEVAQRVVPLPWLKDLYLEGFVNPGDISPQIYPAPGAPLNLKPPTSPLFQLREKDRRGDIECGFRIGGRVGQFAGTLNYLSLYTDSGHWESRAPLLPGPPSPANPFPTDNKYSRRDMYGVSLNYSFPYPINITATYEGVYSPDEPYQDRYSRLPHIRHNKTLKHAIRFDRKTFVLPHPISAMMIQLQYSQTLVEDHDKIKSTPAPYTRGSNNIDSTKNVIALLLSQDLWHNNIKLTFKGIYDLDDCYYIVPGFKYKHGDHLIFDIYGVVLGGAETRTGSFGSIDWADEVFSRITYQF